MHFCMQKKVWVFLEILHYVQNDKVARAGRMTRMVKLQI